MRSCFAALLWPVHPARWRRRGRPAASPPRRARRVPAFVNVRRFTEPATERPRCSGASLTPSAGKGQKSFSEPRTCALRNNSCAQLVILTDAAGCQARRSRPNGRNQMSKMPPAPRSHVNRRDFLRAATAAAVAPMIVPRHVVARSQATPPSDRITIGFIGVGSMGGGHVRGFLKMPDVRILAISDVRLENLERAPGRGQSGSMATRNAPRIPISASCWRGPTSMRSSSPPENAGIR